MKFDNEICKDVMKEIEEYCGVNGDLYVMSKQTAERYYYYGRDRKFETFKWYNIEEMCKRDGKIFNVKYGAVLEKALKEEIIGLVYNPLSQKNRRFK
jgi:bisphosphoglycerate-independent phosphoglycerate mutase (AlkP superfamily)